MYIYNRNYRGFQTQAKVYRVRAICGGASACGSNIGRWRQEDKEFKTPWLLSDLKVNLGCVRPRLEKKNKTNHLPQK